MKKIDLFKLSVVIILIFLITILFRFSQILNTYSDNGRFTLSTDGIEVIDTRNGTVYMLPNNKKINNEIPRK